MNSKTITLNDEIEYEVFYLGTRNVEDDVFNCENICNSCKKKCPLGIHQTEEIDTL